MQREVAGEIEARPGRVEQEQELVGAVLVEEVIFAPVTAHLPEMLDHARDLALGEGEPVFVDIAVLDIAVALHQLVVGLDRIGAGITAGEAEQREQHAVVLAGLGAVIDRVGEQPGVLGLARAIESQERVAEHGGGIVHVGRGKDQRGAGRTDGLGPGLETRAGLGLEAALVEAKALVQPAIAGDEGALRMLHGLIIGDWVGRRVEERGKRRRELGLRIGLAVSRQKETGAVDQAVIAGAEPVRTIVQKGAPSRFRRKRKRFGFGDELIAIGVVGSFGVVRGEKEKCQESDKPPNRRRPLSLGCAGTRSAHRAGRARCRNTPPSAAGSATRNGRNQAST